MQSVESEDPKILDQVPAEQPTHAELEFACKVVDQVPLGHKLHAFGDAAPTKIDHVPRLHEAHEPINDAP